MFMVIDLLANLTITVLFYMYRNSFKNMYSCIKLIKKFSGFLRNISCSLIDTNQGASDYTKDYSFTNLETSKAPMGHQHHVTARGRADSSLAPFSHSKHVIETGTPSPAPLTTRGIHIQNRPTTGTSFGSLPVSRSITFESFLPQQILTPRNEMPTDHDSRVGSSHSRTTKHTIPDVIVEDDDSTAQTRAVESKSVKMRKQRIELMADEKTRQLSSLKPTGKAAAFREGSPLPQQILTPRVPDNIGDNDLENIGYFGNTGQNSGVSRKGKKKKKGNTSSNIGRKSNVLHVSERDRSTSPYRPRSTSPNVQAVVGSDLENEVSDIDV